MYRYRHLNSYVYINIYLKQEKLDQSESENKITIEKIESLQEVNIQLNEELLEMKVKNVLGIYCWAVLVYLYLFLFVC
jgi:uncharacterized membrane protein (DUF106 family)